MFVEVTDFDVQPYNIANAIEVVNSLTAFIAREEQKRFIEVFGYDFYNQFVTGLAVLPTPDVKWTKLRDGGEYIEPVMGIKYILPSMKQVFIPYIYSMWLRSTFDNDSAAGVAMALVENAEIISPSTRICNAYNDHVSLLGNWRLNNSVYGFLNSNVEDYPDFEFNCDSDQMNIFNI
jgi:hypothetical protein